MNFKRLYHLVFRKIDFFIWPKLPVWFRHWYCMKYEEKYRALYIMDPRYFTISSWDDPLDNKHPIFIP